MIKVLGDIIWKGSISVLIIGGAIVILGKCYDLGKEIGEDVYTLKSAKKLAKKQ